MINIIHYTSHDKATNTHYLSPSPVHLERPFRLTYEGARRILKREKICGDPCVVRIEFAHYTG